MSLADLRQDYRQAALLETEANPDQIGPKTILPMPIGTVDRQVMYDVKHHIRP
jgi:hypothetical protein